MDKIGYLRLVKLAIADRHNGNAAFESNTLNCLERHLEGDIKAEESTSVTSVRDSNWEHAAKGFKITCKRLRSERDAARKYIAKTDQEHKDLIVERDTFKQGYENLVRTHEALWDGYGSLEDSYRKRVSERDKLQAELDAAVEHCDRVCGQRNAFRDERDKARAGYDALQNTIDRMREDHDAERDALQRAYDVSVAERDAILTKWEDGNRQWAAKLAQFESLAAERDQAIRDRNKAEVAVVEVMKDRDMIRDSRNKIAYELDAANESIKNVTADRDGTDRLFHDAVLQRDNLRTELNQIRTAVVKQGRPASDYSNLVEENAGLRVQIKAIGKQLDDAKKFHSDEHENRLTLQSENEGLASDLRKCQAELAEASAAFSGFDHVIIVRSKTPGRWETYCGGGTLYSDRDSAARQVETLLGAIEPHDDDSAGEPEPCPVSDRLAALEDQVELMGAQFEAYCKVTNERLDVAGDRAVERIHAVHKRIDKLKSI